MKGLVTAAALLAFAFSLHAADRIVHRDWTRFPAVVELDTPNDIYAIGDAHSDYVRFARAMHGAGLIDAVPARPEEARWVAGHAVLVVTGDMIDKGPRALDVLTLLMTVREDARRKGGIVILLAGNHEAEFLADPSAPKGKEFAAQLKAAQLDPAETGACGNDVGRFLCSLAFAARVNDWFFSHAGNSGGRTLAQLSADLQNGVDRDGFRTRQLLDGNSLLEARLDEEGPHGKPWFDQKRFDQKRFDQKKFDQELTGEGTGERKLLADYAASLGVSHIVEGHKPSEVTFADGLVRHPGEMFQRFGLLFLIDSGMSEGVGYSQGAVLHITAGGKKAIAICPGGATATLWEPGITKDFGRAAACRN